jgi:hypothetical protein
MGALERPTRATEVCSPETQVEGGVKKFS